MVRLRHVALVVAVLALLPPAGAEEEGEGAPLSPYTDAELQALDRALHAVNGTREDLAFDRDKAKGHACFERVRRMLADPLHIAVVMDAWATRTRRAGVAGLVQQLAKDELASTPTRPWEPSPAASGWPREGAFETAEALAAELDRRLQATDPASFTGTEAGGAVRPATRVLDTEDGRALRLALPAQMAWHDVFASPFGDAETARLQEALEARDDAWVHEEAGRVDLGLLFDAWLALALDPEQWRALSPALFPTDAPLVLETPRGRVALGTPNDDVYAGDYAVLIDPGGDDRYVGCRIGAADGGRNMPVGLLVDLGGDDVYACGDVDFTLGAAILGVAAFYDLGRGDDRYEGGHASLGAAMGGVAVFYDDGGSDVYEGKTFTQGAAGFGLGLFFDDATQPAPETSSDEGTPDPVEIGLFDNDRLFAWANAQAFARGRGIALCVNRRGNDVYQAGGVYLHAPLFSDRYQSFSQGFAIGQRNIDHAGGIAMLIDHDGNDRYLGDVYNQGVGYWYAAGLLWDGGGNDVYEMTQYGQGSGIHLAVGGLVDVSGHDTYVMHSGLGQGGSHDYACSILHDRGGNDRYLGNTSCNGSGLTNSVGIHIDRGGDDVYGARRRGGVNFGRPARGFSSLGILLDLEGEDDYLGVMEDGATWRHTDLGVGVDVPAAEGRADAPAVTPVADRPSEAVQIPDVVTYEGDLEDDVFQQLWDVARRWEVGDNRVIVPRARERLVAFGPAVLEKLDAKVATDVSGLDLRAHAAVLQGLREAGHEEAVAAFLERNARSGEERRRRVALHLVGELGAKDLAPLAAAALSGEDEDLAVRAAGILALLESDAGDAVLAPWLAPDAGERRILAALPVLVREGNGRAFGLVRPLLGHEGFSVRTALATRLARFPDTYGGALAATLGEERLPTRASRTLLDALARAKAPPLPPAFIRVVGLLGHGDWGVRADAARVLSGWIAHEGTDAEVRALAEEALATLLEGETDPYVRFVAAGGSR